MSEIIRHYTNEFRSGRDVQPLDAEVFFDEIISVTDADALAQMLAAWSKKGPTEDEIFRFAAIMRSRMERLDHDKKIVGDIVGTGGSRAKTFNISTAAAFVAAGAGLEPSSLLSGGRGALQPAAASTSAVTSSVLVQRFIVLLLGDRRSRSRTHRGCGASSGEASRDAMSEFYPAVTRLGIRSARSVEDVDHAAG